MYGTFHQNQAYCIRVILICTQLDENEYSPAESVIVRVHPSYAEVPKLMFNASNMASN